MIRHILLPAFLLTLAGCGPLINGGADPDRLNCLGEGAEARCQTVWDRDLGASYPAGRSQRGSYTSAPIVTVSPETAARSVPVVRDRSGVAAISLPAACLIGDRAYPQGSQAIREVTGQYRGIGFINPQPLNGQSKQEICTCSMAERAGPYWACI